MLINKAYKIELKPNKRQITQLRKAAGSARFAYNWGLNYRTNLYKSTKENINNYGLHKVLNTLKKELFPWMYEVSKCAPQEALADLESAFKRFFKKQGKFPRFKKKGSSKRSFRISSGNFYFTKNAINIAKIGLVRLKESTYLPEEGCKFLALNIKEEAPNRWYISVSSEEEYTDVPTQTVDVIGIDVGIKDLAVCSDGIVIDNPHAYYVNESKIKRLQRIVSRRAKGSANRRKAVRTLSKAHFNVKNIRRDVINKFTSALVKTKPVVIVLEDLAVKNMLKNHKLSKHISDAAFGEIRRQIEYKAKWYGSKVIVANRFYPSSKKCSVCGSIKSSLLLSERVFKCGECGESIPRDYNASVNLRMYGEDQIKSTLSSRESYACGERKLQGPPLREGLPVPLGEARRKLESAKIL